MHAHRIEILDGADDDAVVRLVADHFHLEFLPADHRLLEQHLAGRGRVEPAGDDLLELLAVVRNAATAAAERERGADHRREADLGLDRERFLEAVRDARARAVEPDVAHGVAEQFAVLGHVDRFARGGDQFDVVLFEHAFAHEIERAVERRLAAHRGQQRAGTFLFDDAGDRAPVDRLDVDRVGHLRVGHDRRRVRVHQDDPVPLLAQRLARLGAGVIELARLADDDRAGADDQDAFEVCALGHAGGDSCDQTVLRIGAVPDLRSMDSTNCANSGTRSRGPGLASGWPWKLNAGRSTQVMPCSEPSNSDLWVTLHVRWQRRLVDGETVVLRRDQHAAGLDFEHGVVGAVVTELHLDGLRAHRETEDLVAEADAEDRCAVSEEFTRGLDRIRARLRIAGAVREKDTVRCQRHDIRSRGLRRHDRHAAAVVGEQAQDVALDAEVVGHDVQALAGPATRTLFQRPVRALVPLVGTVGADDPGKVHALQTREAPCRLDREVGAQRGIAAGDAAGLRTFFAQDARQLAGVDLGDGNRIPATQELRQGFGGAPAGVQQRQVADHETGGVDETRLVIVGVGAGIADVRVGQRDDLPGIRRVGQDFLVARHGGVEHHLAGRRAGGADGNAAKHSAVL